MNILSRVSTLLKPRATPLPTGAGDPFALVNETSTGFALHCPHCDAYQSQFGGLAIAAGQIPHSSHTCSECAQPFRT